MKIKYVFIIAIICYLIFPFAEAYSSVEQNAQNHSSNEGEAVRGNQQKIGTFLFELLEKILLVAAGVIFGATLAPVIGDICLTIRAKKVKRKIKSVMENFKNSDGDYYLQGKFEFLETVADYCIEILKSCLFEAKVIYYGNVNDLLEIWSNLVNIKIEIQLCSNPNKAKSDKFLHHKKIEELIESTVNLSERNIGIIKDIGKSIKKRAMK